MAAPSHELRRLQASGHPPLALLPAACSSPPRPGAPRGPEDPFLALRDAQGLDAGNREQAVGAGLATRRFGDATLARGW
jgi:hypothetical protein